MKNKKNSENTVVLPKKPFFTRYLEKQELDNVTGARTLKYPSDGDE